MVEPVKVIQPDEGLRFYGCGLCGEEIPDGCSVAGKEKRGKLVGVAAWRAGTSEDGKQGLVAVHECGVAVEMPDDVQQHHDQLRGEAPPNSGVSEV